MRKQKDRWPLPGKLFAPKATTETGLPSIEQFQQTRVIDAAGTEVTAKMMRESFDNAWFWNWKPAEIKTSQPELLSFAAGLVRKPDQTTWNRAEFVLDPQVPAGEIWLCVPDKPVLSTKIINIVL